METKSAVSSRISEYISSIIQSKIAPQELKTDHEHKDEGDVKGTDSKDIALLLELLKDPRRSDRELAKVLKISQPTITRRRGKLEKELIDGYTVIPKWEKIGFELVAFTLFKVRTKYSKPEERQAARRKAEQWCPTQPNVVFAIGGEGMGFDGICLSFHRKYSEFLQFKRSIEAELPDFISDTQSFIADLNPSAIIKPLHFKYIADVK